MWSRTLRRAARYNEELWSGIKGTMDKKLRRGVVFFDQRADGKILAVSRGLHKPWDWNLPGGKVEKSDRTGGNAIIREVYEETGLLILDPVEIMTRSDGEFHVIAYGSAYVHGKHKWFSKEGWVRYVTPETLCKGLFGEYNKLLLQVLQEQKDALDELTRLGQEMGDYDVDGIRLEVQEVQEKERPE